ncbi:MAG TPA: phosphoglucosamine mutase [Cyanobacteria bacterium UBA8530]|nr:phosphoglucosamine mutase [Cyanobacteria bacterium UBA8530]
MGKYFGTDGVRGLANAQLTPELAFKLGRCGAARLMKEGGKPFIVLGRDTRRSGTMLEAALAAGICSVGVDVRRLGVATTPAVAWVTKRYGALAGVMISASHNPAPDNGIKFFSKEGFKLPDITESEIEEMIDAPRDELPHPSGSGIGVVTDDPSLLEDYIRFAVSILPSGLKGLKVAVDCANGAAYRIAPQVLRELGAEVTVLGDRPDGDNINLGCGSTYLEALAGEVVRGPYDLGLAFDGDADRLLAVDSDGQAIDGDKIMLICYKHLRRHGLLRSPSLVSTVMSNFGLEKAIEEEGGKLIRAKVGDRYVLEEMLARDIRIGGEQSGHVIFLDHNTTGDGLITALRLLSALRDSGRTLHDLASEMKKYPQLLKNLRVSDTKGWEENKNIRAAITRAEKELGQDGRLVVRASGTEPLLRVMAEGSDQNEIEKIVDQILKVMAEELLHPVAR